MSSYFAELAREERLLEQCGYHGVPSNMQLLREVEDLRDHLEALEAKLGLAGIRERCGWQVMGHEQ